ncbi:MAG: hypothetical protein A3F83_10075 [Candidatus Glassbacteria bacterium RIFCSPLOWO2_12_FULL_58_11]|uniref:Cell division protein ZapB n=2 Tax=Candidatus Glassiibacteriota TaxID=1817805 RepID=A0A1F5Z3X7_9BACT|nr:MAG: hypothetical protein A2Z86_08485 [Candidatus Glassbacteria bacterium GWA2_58_10]OGG06877.1 MAG: hypothetical protein A3F83_10075 [Candidatus Glassbacteria bacterium RIFCSPLOWO2_12_FULL_58_11]
MTEALDRLEAKIRELIAGLESLREENNAFRRAAGQGKQRLSTQELIGRIESLKLENERLQGKTSRAGQALEQIIEKFDKLDL